MLKQRLVTFALLVVLCPVHAQEKFRLKAQNAGDIVYNGVEFAVHLDGNYVPDSKYVSGPSHCAKRNPPGVASRTGTRLIVIADKNEDFNFTRRWLWENLRPILVDEIVPDVCPDAKFISVNVYIKGLDTVISGEPYNTNNVELPLVVRPPAAEFSTSKDDFMNEISYIPGFVFNREKNDFVSNGIVAASFPLADEFCKSGGNDCSLKTFRPNYYAFLPPIASAPPTDYPLERRAENGDKEAVAEIERRYTWMDSHSSFRHLVEKKKEYNRLALAREKKREERAARNSYYAQFWRDIDNVIKEHGFWTLFVAGALGSRNGCEPRNSPLCTADYQAVQNVPLLLK